MHPHQNFHPRGLASERPNDSSFNPGSTTTGEVAGLVRQLAAPLMAG